MFDMKNIMKHQLIIKNKKEEIKELFQLAQDANNRGLDDMVEAFQEEAQQKLQEIKEHQKVIDAFHEAMNTLPDDMQTLLKSRYEVGASWDDVSQILGMSIAKCQYLHGKALILLDGGDADD